MRIFGRRYYILQIHRGVKENERRNVMGLDMYMRSIRKIPKEEAALFDGMHIDEIRTKYNAIPKDMFDEDFDVYGELKPFLTEIKLVNTEFDLKQCLADRGYKVEDIIGSGHFGGHLTFYLRGQIKVELTQVDLAKYTKDVERPGYIWDEKEVAYWREERELDDYIETLRVEERSNINGKKRNSPIPIEQLHQLRTHNCHRYLLSQSEKVELFEYLKDLERPFYDKDITYDFLLDDKLNIFYHAWW